MKNKLEALRTARGVKQEELAAALGLASKFAECMLAVKYRRVRRDGTRWGGPMAVMETRLGTPFLLNITGLPSGGLMLKVPTFSSGPSPPPQALSSAAQATRPS